MNTASGHTAHKLGDPAIRGDLLKREYEIYCPLIEGPDYKNNYYQSSCRLRITDRSCTNERCVYYEINRESNQV